MTRAFVLPLPVSSCRFARAQPMQTIEVADAANIMWYPMQFSSVFILNFTFGTCSGRRAVRSFSLFGRMFSSLGSFLMGACAE